MKKETFILLLQFLSKKNMEEPVYNLGNSRTFVHKTYGRIVNEVKTKKCAIGNDLREEKRRKERGD